MNARLRVDCQSINPLLTMALNNLAQRTSENFTGELAGLSINLLPQDPRLELAKCYWSFLSKQWLQN